jgi:hypothetical protein
MSNKTTILRTFNTHFVDFIDDIIKVIPENSDILAAKSFFEITKKANPTLIIKIWFSLIYSPYTTIIDSGDLEFFINKNYAEDLSTMQNSKEILKAIDSLRDPIKNMTETNKTHCLKYIQNLCKLSAVYNSMSM